MALTINLVTDKKNEINNFLLKFFGKDMMTDSDTTEWSYALQNPLDSINLISALIDGDDELSMTIWISFDPNVFIKVHNKNYNDVIKYILQRFQKAS